ncbi:MAG: GNAT family acetyltransferase [Stigonema ocellatum SAG 48.90 = DSM 106950]|nr:GNAT family acetyltransferase [Stigonema ocellatum SAG 48.90 = DSM 106950]
MTYMEIRPFQLPDKFAVIRLWEECGLIRPWNDPNKDIERKLSVQPDLFLVGLVEQELVATVMAGYEGHRGWINYLAVAPDYQRKGLGRAMMVQVERRLREAGCPKINLLVRSENNQVIEFYKHLGYIVDDVISLGKRLER